MRLPKRLDARLLRRVLAVPLPVLGLLIAATRSDAEEGDLPRQKLTHGPGVANHPVRVRPSAAVRIPPDWPVDADGRITCLTCHEKLPSLNGRSPSYLRDFDGRKGHSVAFCAKCHADVVGAVPRNMHWVAMRFAHVRVDRRSSAPAPGMLDGESRRCLGCHDGVSAPDSANPIGEHRRSDYDLQRNHPVGVRYPAATSPGRRVPLRPAAMLPPAVRLPDDQVSCVSCHDLYSDRPARLTAPLEGSALCFTCHPMD